MTLETMRNRHIRRWRSGAQVLFFRLRTADFARPKRQIADNTQYLPWLLSCPIGAWSC